MRPGSFILVVLFCAACGGSPPAPGGTQTETQTFTGTTRSIAAGSCSGDNHGFSAADGTIRVVLVSTSPATRLTAEICAPGVTDKTTQCTLVRSAINVGQTIEMPRKSGAQQVLSLLHPTCGTNDPPTTDPITYVASVTYRK